MHLGTHRKDVLPTRPLLHMGFTQGTLIEYACSNQENAKRYNFYLVHVVFTQFVF